MTLFVIIIIPIIIVQFIIIYKLRNFNIHDGILFSFCDLRRNIMGYLRKREFDIKPKEYKEIKNLLSTVNPTIHNFNQHTITIFNIKKVKTLLSNAKNETQRIEEQTNGSISKEIESFYTEYICCYLKAVLAYTPFLKWKLVGLIISLIIKINIERMKSFLNYYSWFNKEYENFLMGSRVTS